MSLRLLLMPRILSLRHSVSAGASLRKLPILVIGALFWWLLYMGTSHLLTFVRGMGITGEILSEKLFSVIFSGLFGFLLLSSVITALSSYYLARDIPFFLSRPVEIMDLQWLKMFDTILNSSWMVISFIPPVFIAYGISYNAAASFYILLMSGMLLFILIAAGIGISVSHLLTRIFPARRSRHMLLGIGLILFISLYFLLKSVIPDTPGTPEEILGSFLRFNADSPLLPGFWLKAAVFPGLKGARTDLFYFLLLLTNSAFFLMLASMIGTRLYLTNLERLAPAPGPSGRSALSNWYPGHKAALLYKDTNIFFRDAGQWSQLFIIGALILIYLNNFRSIPLDALSGVSPFITEIMLLVNMLMAGLILTAVAARFLFPMVSLEGEAFWVIRTAPVKPEKFLWSKLTYGSIPVTGIITFLVIAANAHLNIGWPVMIASVVTVFMLCLSVSGLGTGMGAIYPRFRHENTASVSVSGGSLFFMIIAFGLVTVTLALEVWIFYLLQIKPVYGPGRIALVSAGIILILFINTAAFYLPMKIGADRLTALSSSDS